MSNTATRFLVLGSAMRLNTLKTVTWASILFVAVLVTFLVNSFVTRPTVQDLNIPPLVESGNEETKVQNIGCDPLVIVMDANGKGR